MPSDSFYVWDGVYDNFQQAQVHGRGFASDEWVTRSCDRLRLLRKQPQAEQFAVHEYLLPSVIASLTKPGLTIKIVDFAGGVGIEYEQACSALGGALPISYHIVDNPAICQVGADLHAGDEKICFHTDLSALPESVDLVHIGSALQYIDDWQSLVGRLARLQPTLFLLSDVYAGDFDSFVSIQNLYGSRVPFRFLNFDEIVVAFSNMGYQLVLRTRYYRAVLGNIGPLPMDNLPSEFRLDFPWHLMFRVAP